MTLFQKTVQKRRMPDERIANLVRRIEFEKEPDTWLPQFEALLHGILRHEFYLDRIPNNLTLPKYRSVLVKNIYRMLSQVSQEKHYFSKGVDLPDPLIQKILSYLRDSENRRREIVYNRYPVTAYNIKTILNKLKEELEI